MSYAASGEGWQPMTVEEREQAYLNECEDNRAQWARWIGLPENMDHDERDRAIEQVVTFLQRTGSVLDIGDK